MENEEYTLLEAYRTDDVFLKNILSNVTMFNMEEVKNLQELVENYYKTIEYLMINKDNSSLLVDETQYGLENHLKELEKINKPDETLATRKKIKSVLMGYKSSLQQYQSDKFLENYEFAHVDYDETKEEQYKPKLFYLLHLSNIKDKNYNSSEIIFTYLKMMMKEEIDMLMDSRDNSLSLYIDIHENKVNNKKINIDKYYDDIFFIDSYKRKMLVSMLKYLFGYIYSLKDHGNADKNKQALKDYFTINEMLNNEFANPNYQMISEYLDSRAIEIQKNKKSYTR